MTVNRFAKRGWQMDFAVRLGGKNVRVKKACKGARNQREALAMERAERDRLVNRGAMGEAPTFAAFRVEFLENYARANNKPSEYQTKRDVLAKHLGPAFDSMLLDEIQDEQVEAYKSAKLLASLKAKTINNHLAVLSKLLVTARRWKRIASVPEIQRLKVPEAEFDFFTFDEARELAKHAGGYPCGDMIRFALNTGLRQGELIGLRVMDVLDGKILVRQSIVRGVKGTPKSHKPREVSLNAVAARQLTTGLASGFGGVALVFHGDDHMELSKGDCKWPLWMACKRAGLRRVGWHVLRHTFASHLAMRGVPIKSIQELLGHSDIRQTMRYAHLSPDVKEDAVKLLEMGYQTARKGTRTVRTARKDA